MSLGRNKILKLLLQFYSSFLLSLRPSRHEYSLLVQTMYFLFISGFGFFLEGSAGGGVGLVGVFGEGEFLFF